MKKTFLLLATLLVTSIAFAQTKVPVESFKELYLVGDMTGPNKFLPDYKFNTVDGIEYTIDNTSSTKILYGKFQVKVKGTYDYYGVPKKGTFLESGQTYTLNGPKGKDRNFFCFSGKVAVSQITFNLETQELSFQGASISESDYFDVQSDQKLNFYADVPKNLSVDSVKLDYKKLTLPGNELALYSGSYVIPEDCGDKTICAFVGDYKYTNYKFGSNGIFTVADTSAYQMVPVIPTTATNVVISKVAPYPSYKAGDTLKVRFKIDKFWKSELKVTVSPLIKNDTLYLVGDMAGSDTTYLPEYALYSTDSLNYKWSSTEGVEMYGRFKLAKDTISYGVPYTCDLFIPGKEEKLYQDTLSAVYKSSFPGKILVKEITFNNKTGIFTYHGDPVQNLIDVNKDLNFKVEFKQPSQVAGQAISLNYTLVEEGGVKGARYYGTYKIPSETVIPAKDLALAISIVNQDLSFGSNEGVLYADSAFYYESTFKSKDPILLVTKEGAAYKPGDELTFQFIVEADGRNNLFYTITEATAVDEVSAAPIVYANNGTVYADASFVIYNLVGQDVTAYNGQLKGLYLVKVDNQVVKLIVQ